MNFLWIFEVIYPIEFVGYPKTNKKCIQYVHLNHLKWSKPISNVEGHEKSLPTMIYT